RAQDPRTISGGGPPGLSRVGPTTESGSTPPGWPAGLPAPPGWPPAGAPPGPAGVPAGAPVPGCPVPVAPAPAPVPVAVLRASTVNATAAISAHTSHTFRFTPSCPPLRTPRGTPDLARGGHPMLHRTPSVPLKTPAGSARLDSSDEARTTRVRQNWGHGSSCLTSLVKPP